MTMNLILVGSVLVAMNLILVGSVLVTMNLILVGSVFSDNEFNISGLSF